MFIIINYFSLYWRYTFSRVQYVIFKNLPGIVYLTWFCILYKFCVLFVMYICLRRIRLFAYSLVCICNVISCRFCTILFELRRVEVVWWWTWRVRWYWLFLYIVFIHALMLLLKPDHRRLLVRNQFLIG